MDLADDRLERVLAVVDTTAGQGPASGARSLRAEPRQQQRAVRDDHGVAGETLADDGDVGGAAAHGTVGGAVDGRGQPHPFGGVEDDEVVRDQRPVVGHRDPLRRSGSRSLGQGPGQHEVHRVQVEPVLPLAVGAAAVVDGQQFPEVEVGAEDAPAGGQRRLPVGEQRPRQGAVEHEQASAGLDGDVDRDPLEGAHAVRAPSWAWTAWVFLRSA